MVNLIGARRIVPELVQADYTAEKVTAELEKIIPDGPERERMVQALIEIRSGLRGNSGNMPAVDCAARATYDLLRREQ